jgi:succinoglycan biosynthesis transport protein ExoP
MEFLPYLKILWERKWVLIAAIVVTMAVTFIGVKLLPSTYQAKATVRVLTAISGDAVWLVRDTLYADRLMNTYATLATSHPVLDTLMTNLQLEELPSIEVNFVVNTELLEIVVEDTDPALAANVANGLAQLIQTQSWQVDTVQSQQMLNDVLNQIETNLATLRTERQELLDAGGGTTQIESLEREISLNQNAYDSLAGQYGAVLLRDLMESTTVTIVDDARVPTVPSGPNTKLFLTLGAFVSIAGGIGLALLFHMIDRRLSSDQKIAQVVHYPILGKIPNVARPQPTAYDEKSFESEAFRRLRVNFLTLNHNNHEAAPTTTELHTLLITSAEPKEGKSTITASLAFSLAQAGITTLIIDTDLRKPTLHKIFDLPNDIGLSDVLEGRVSLFDAVQHVSQPGVGILTSGSLPSAPTELLSQKLTADLLHELGEQYDMVLLDSPAFLAVTDASVMIPRVDGVLLVVRRTQAHQDEVEETCRQLEKLNANLLGVIINNAKLQDEYHYYLHYLDEVKQER